MIGDQLASHRLTELAGKRVLVTGAAGFIGGHLTRRLVAEGALVSAFVWGAADQRALADVADRVSFYVVDISQAEAVHAAMAHIQPEIVFHLAAIGTGEPAITLPLALRVNVGGTRHLLEAACRVGIRRLIHTGTAYEYGEVARYDLWNGAGLDVLGMYAASKSAAHALVQEYARADGLPAVSLRLFAVYGPGQSVRSLVPGAIHAALEGRDFPMTLGEQLRDFVFVGDVVEGYLRAALAVGVEGATLDLGTGQARSIRDVVLRLFELTGSRSRPLMGTLPYRPDEMMRQVADQRPARERLDWQATTLLEDGLRQTIEWYRQQSAGDYRLSAISHHPREAVNYA